MICLGLSRLAYVSSASILIRHEVVKLQKHQMTSAWHPMHIVVVAGLSLHFIASVILQTSKEILRLPINR